MGATTEAGATARPARGKLHSTEGFFEGKSPRIVYAVGLTFTAVLLLLDYRWGHRISFSLFYLMPLGLVTWNMGRRAGMGAALICTVASLVVDLVGPGADNDLVPYGNALGRFAVFIAFAVLLATLKEALTAQRQRVEREHEVSSGLREMNEVKDTLLHAVSHDLKGPLAGIIGAMSTLRRGNELQLTADEVESLYQMIEQSGRKMNRLIDDMLDLERLDRGQVQPEREPTDVGEMVRRVAREAPGMDTHPVRIDGEQLLANIDPAKVERIVENLLVNAARHTPGGTPVHVAVRSSDDGIMLVVEDEGPGVPEELKSTLFDPFRQGPTAAGRGVGIGLSLVRSFAELHGGSANIEDRHGGGARFVVMLPCEIKPLEPASARLHAV
ncbi:MAG: ATP-binding protein [Actinomycetota bacterium]